MPSDARRDPWGTRPDVVPAGREATTPDPARVAEDAAAQQLERARAGDARAFGGLFRAHREEVARLVQRLLGPTADLEDVVQEVFLQVHRYLPDFRGQARFSTWLYRVTVNVVRMHRRAARSRPLLVGRWDVATRLVATPASRPDEAAARHARQLAFRRLIDRLSEKKRTVWVLHELEGMAPDRIAEIVAAPVLTVRTRLFYARRDLETMLGEEPELAGLLDELANDDGGARR